MIRIYCFIFAAIVACIWAFLAVADLLRFRGFPERSFSHMIAVIADSRVNECSVRGYRSEEFDYRVCIEPRNVVGQFVEEGPTATADFSITELHCQTAEVSVQIFLYSSRVPGPLVCAGETYPQGTEIPTYEPGRLTLVPPNAPIHLRAYEQFWESR